MREPTHVYYYIYNTPEGAVRIEPRDGRYQVLFDNEALGSYASPEAAADDVSGGHTFTPSSGVDLGELGIPDDLGEWTRRPFAVVMPLRKRP